MMLFTNGITGGKLAISLLAAMSAALLTGSFTAYMGIQDDLKNVVTKEVHARTLDRIAYLEKHCIKITPDMEVVDSGSTYNFPL